LSYPEIDQRDKTPFNLIKKTQGAITYEHCVVQRLYGEIYIGDAERNYYVDKRHEINLCVHFNFRTPGRFAFVPEYRFYVTDGRLSLSLHWGLGVIDSENIIEEYQSLESAKKSEYYEDFCQLKEKIDNEILRQQKLTKKNVIAYDNSVQYSSKEIAQKGTWTICEVPFSKTMEFVQFHICEETKEWLFSTSDQTVIDLWRYLNDFYEIEPTELQLLKYYPMNNSEISRTSKYFDAYQRVKEFIEMMNVSWG